MDNDFFIRFMMEKIRWRYLDVLDSLRFAEEKEFKRRELHAKPTFFLSLLMGHGIVVPNNQLMDSFGFITFASELIKSIEKSGITIFTPIKLAYFGDNSAFEVTARAFERIKHDNDPTRFVLSAWPILDRDYARRQAWAKNLREKSIIPEGETEDKDEYKRTKDLYYILNFFDQNQKHKEEAVGIKGIRILLLENIIDISESDKEVLFANLTEDQIKIVQNIITVLKNVRSMNVPLDLRSEIKTALEQQEGRSFENTSPILIEDIKAGVMKTVDSVYNYSLYIATRAKQDDHTEEMGKVFIVGEDRKIEQDDVSIWGYPEGSYLLSSWVRSNYESTVRSNERDLVSMHDFKFNSILEKEKFDEVLSNLTFDQMIEEYKNPEWRNSITKYLKSLHEYEKVTVAQKQTKVEKLTAGERKVIIDATKRYEESRDNHLRFIVENILSPTESIEESKNGKYVFKLITSDGKPVITAGVEGYAESPGENREAAILEYAKKPADGTDIKGVTSE